ncbi:MAG TPA: DUF1688 family protein [Acetobacteraceae bacterium]|nr:DUF1688 family protein [Acetobacteraceae bacterium]
MSERSTLAWLRTPEAVRERCHAMLALAERDALPHFMFDPARLDDAADYVAAVTRANYPDLAIPYHARWRHFEAGGIDRWEALAVRLRGCDPTEVARLRIELCTVSVLLDAGAGPYWKFREPGTGLELTRSEGLAVASLHAFCSGLFSADPLYLLRADADGLSRLSDAALAAAFQVATDNPLAGVAGRAALLRNLGAALRSRGEARIGGLLDVWRSRAVSNELPARELLITILELLAPIWPVRMTLDGENPGDVWPHSALHGDGPTARLIPFHKLSQWLAYSVVEVLEQTAIKVVGLDDLTGLAEYRNGGLFVDLGVLRLRNPSLAVAPLPVDHIAIVEWRALTVALLDRLAPMLRARLAAADLPLARLLQGGTWDAGRRMARERRADGSPPLVVQSDGTVF